MSHSTTLPFALPDWCRDFPMESLASRFGTPFYLYDADTLRAASARFRQAFGPETELLFAVKANPNPAILQLMQREALVDGLDIASPGELELAQLAGWLPGQLSYTGPAKRRDALEQALALGVGTICVESVSELRELQELAQLFDALPATQIMLRLNPAEELHAFGMQISGRPSPFGIDEEALDALFPEILELSKPLPLGGIHIHAGSQCLSARAMARGMSRALKLARRFEAMGIPVPCLNLGGGFGVNGWRPTKILDPVSVAGHLRGLLQPYPHQLRIRIEPGRGLIGPAGIYVARVIQCKQSRGQSFAILDGGMNHYFSATGAELQSPQKPIWVENLSRPDPASDLAPASASHSPVSLHQLCGPLCTTRDRTGVNVQLPAPAIGDLLGWPNAGAYGLSASPFFFLGHPTPVEILHDKGTFRCIRESVSITALGSVLL